MNLIVVSVLYGSQSNLIEIVGGGTIAIVFFRLISSLAVFVIFFYLLYAYFHIRFYNDILAENRSIAFLLSPLEGKKIDITEMTTAPVVQDKPDIKTSQEMVLFNKPAPSAQTPPPNALVLAKPAESAPTQPNALVLSKPAEQTKPSLPNPSAG